MGDFQNQGMGMAVGEMQNYESDRYNIFDHNAYSHASSHISSIEALDLYEIAVDEFNLIGDGGTVEENNYSHTSSHMSSIEPLDLYEIPVDEFSLVGDGGTVEANIENPMGYSDVSSTPESGQKCEAPPISTQLSPSESYVDSNKVPIAKRPRTVCCYTIEDVIKNLPRSSSVGNQEILQNNISPVVNGFQSDLNLSSPKLSVSSLSSDLLMGSKENVAQKNISAVANGFLSDLNLSSPKLSVSSLSSSLIGSKENLQNNISPVATGFHSDFSLSSPKISVSSLSRLLNIDSADQKMDKFQLYRDSVNRLSVEPQSVAARHRRRKIQGKIRSLEKFVPLKSKLDTGTMLEEASKYVKFLQAQLRVLELMPSFLSLSNGLGSARTLNPRSKNNVRLHSTSSTVGKGIAMNSNGKVEEQRAGENLSDKEMLHLLVTSRAVQRVLLSQEKCFRTIPDSSCCERFAASNSFHGVQRSFQHPLLNCSTRYGDRFQTRLTCVSSALYQDSLTNF